MSAYLPSASVSDGPEDGHCHPCLADPEVTLTGMISTPQLRTGSCVKIIMYTIKDHTHEHRKKDRLQAQALNATTKNPVSILDPMSHINHLETISPLNDVTTDSTQIDREMRTSTKENSK